MELNNIKISTYLNEICSLIKNKKVHSEIKSELLTHINNLIEYYTKLGYSTEDSVDLALEEMGNSTKLGRELNTEHKPAFDFKLLGTTAFLVFLGFIGLLTFANPSIKIFGSPMYLLEAKNAIYIPIIIIFFFIGTFIKFKWLKKLSLPFYIIALLLCIPQFYNYSNLFAVLLLNKQIMIPALALFGLSGIYEKLKFNSYKSYILAILFGIIPLLLMTFIPLEYQKHMNSSFISMTPLIFLISYFIGSLILIYMHSKKLKLFILTIIIDVIILIVTLYHVILNLIFYNNASSFSTINKILFSAKLFGKTSSTFPINIDYPITGLIGYAGWIPSIIVISFLLYFVYRIFKSSLKINNLYGKSLALSISIIISMRIIIGILINLNLFPYIAVPIPFLSFFGESMCNVLLLLGIFTNIYKNKTLSKKE
ncbi:MAG: permease prefix domain 1-containing protein [Sarcina sp.]